VETEDVLKRGRTNRDQGGFTLVEMVATIVIMGIIVVPLTSALIQALNTVPTSGERTQQATDADRLEARLMQDLTTSNWTQVIKQPSLATTDAAAYKPGGDSLTGSPAFVAHDVPTQSMACPATTTSAGFVTMTVYEDVSDDYIWSGIKVGGKKWNQHLYRVDFTPAGSGIAAVKVIRANQTFVWDGSSSNTPLTDDLPLLTGYCKTTDTAVVATTAAAPSATNQSETYTVKFSVRPTASANPTVFTVSATQRVHGQPPS
jgi:prepilin-type N-terminal cleavage/methylation domain-containing protein